MKYKGFDLTIDISEKDGGFIFRIPGLSSQEMIGENENPTAFQVTQWFHDTVDLHIGRSAERETFEKRIDPEEVAKAIYESTFSSHDYKWKVTPNKEVRSRFKTIANAAIACIKKIDPSIISDDINHGKIHKFDRDAIARKIADEIHDQDWSDLMSTTKVPYFQAADQIISYVEEIVYG